MSDLLFDRNVGWNDLSLIDKFSEEPAVEMRDKLIRQDTPVNLEEQLQSCIVPNG